jgi:hypothetical protein
LLSTHHGCAVSIVTTRPNGEGKPEFRNLFVPIVEDYMPPLLRNYTEAAKWYSLQYDPVAYRAFLRILRNDKPDLVHFHNCQFLTLSLVSAAKRSGRKTVLSVYDYWLFRPTAMLVDPQKRFCVRALGTWCVDCLPPMFRTVQKALLSSLEFKTTP